MEIIVYKLRTCGFCKALLDKLTEQGMSYKVRSVVDPENEEDCIQMNKLFESETYPKVILYDNGNTSFIVSSNSKRLPSVDNVSFYYYNTLEDIIDTIKNKK